MLLKCRLWQIRARCSKLLLPLSSTIIDLYDRSPIASVNDDFINTELAITTLKEALKQEKYPKGLILHSDQGQQFAAWDFVMFCKSQGITQSMSKSGCPYDNAPMERFSVFLNYLIRFSSSTTSSNPIVIYNSLI